MEQNNIVKKLLIARRVSVPLASVTTGDMLALEQTLKDALNGSVPLCAWDMVRGLRGVNQAGVDAVLRVRGSDDPTAAINPVDALLMAGKLSAGCITLMYSAHLWLSDSLAARQAILNLRDQFKSDQRMLVLMSPDLRIPIELQNSVECFDESLPTITESEVIINNLLSGANLPTDPTSINAAAECLSGLSAFAIEQSAAMSLTKSGLDIDSCWERKKTQIEQSAGLSMSAASVSFKDVGGLSSAKEFFSKLMRGPQAPRLIVRVEEVEKLMAGSSSGVGDNTGVSQDILAVLLDRIENNKWLGGLFLGPGGSGKSYFSEALAGEFGVRSITLDTGAMKSSGVGESEAAVRGAFRTLLAIGGNRVLITATCNGMQELKPELQRRLASAGMWFFDLPDESEKSAIWNVQVNKFGLSDSGVLPNDKGWSSSDIRDCCRLAYLLGESLQDAALRINPAMAREPERIESLRRLANGRLSSASYPGPYRLSAISAPAVTGRKIGGE